MIFGSKTQNNFFLKSHALSYFDALSFY